jgi:hypothetical protein
MTASSFAPVSTASTGSDGHGALRASDWDYLRLEFAVRMAHLILAVALDRAHKSGAGDLTAGRPLLAVWMRAMSDSPSMQRTALA